MKNTINTNTNRGLPISNINSYGDHDPSVSRVKLALRRVSSYLHCNKEYDLRNLAEYYIELAKTNPKGTNKAPSLKSENQDLLDAIISLEFNDLGTLNSREIAHLVVAFKDSKDQLHKALSSYIKLKHESPSIDIFIQAFQSAQKNNTTMENLKKTDIQMLFASIKNTMQAGYIFESACSLYGYFYSLLPILEATLSAYTGAFLFTNFGAMFLAGTLAVLSITIFSGLLNGILNRKDQGIIEGALQGLYSEFNQQAAHDNSFHPLVEAVIGALYMTTSFLLIGKLESSAQVGSLLHTFSQYGINNFVLKYSAMNLFFTLKAQLHQGSIDISNLIKNAISGAFRGLVKNAMLNYIALFKLPSAFPGKSYYIVLEIIEINITNISKMIEIFAFSPTILINQLIQTKIISTYFNHN